MVLVRCDVLSKTEIVLLLFLSLLNKAHGLLTTCLVVSPGNIIPTFILQNPHPASTSTEPPTVPPETRQVFVSVIDASKNTLIPSVDYTYTVNQGNDQTDNAATGEFTLTVPLNSNVELTVMKAGFYDNVQSDLIDEDKNWLIVMIPSVTTTSSIMAG